MPAKPGKERPLLELFLSEYEDGSWRDPHPYWADEHEDSAVEVIATRPSDGLKLAVEHTLMQPFPQDRETTKNLVDHFGPVHEDKTLGVPEQETYVNLPEVALRNGCGWNFPQLCSTSTRGSRPTGSRFQRAIRFTIARQPRARRPELQQSDSTRKSSQAQGRLAV